MFIENPPECGNATLQDPKSHRAFPSGVSIHSVASERVRFRIGGMPIARQQSFGAGSTDGMNDAGIQWCGELLSFPYLTPPRATWSPEPRLGVQKAEGASEAWRSGARTERGVTCHRSSPGEPHSRMTHMERRVTPRKGPIGAPD